MVYDLIVKNGIVVDPLRKIHKKQDIYVKNEMFVLPKVDSKGEMHAKKMIDATGCYVFPGLIEGHTHLYEGGSEAGYSPDLMLLPNGVTSAIDQGTAGSANFTSFYNQTILQSKVDIKAFLNISSTGITTEKYIENIDPSFYDRDMIRYLFRKHKDTLIGLKIRMEEASCGEMGITPLAKTIELAEELDCPVAVHIKNPNVPIPEIVNLLRENDTWIHIYQQTGQTIFDQHNFIYPELFEAQKRGVLFDVASGRSAFSFKMIRESMEQGFKPDLLGTDLVQFNYYEKPIFSLLYTMSLYKSFGFTIDELVEKCTVLPAKLMKLDDKIGSLAPGFQADISIVKMKQTDILFEDRHGGKQIGQELLIPMATIKAGRLLYQNIEF